MGYFDGLVDACFRNARDGRTVFYPYGVLGSGYIVGDDTARRIRSFLRTYYLILIPVVIVTVTVARFYAILLLIVFGPFYAIRIRRLLSGAMKVSERISIQDVTRNMATSMGFPACLFLLIVGLLLFTASIAAMVLAGARAVGVLGAIFFGAGVVQAVFLVKYSRQQRRR